MRIYTLHGKNNIAFVNYISAEYLSLLQYKRDKYPPMLDRLEHNFARTVRRLSDSNDPIENRRRVCSITCSQANSFGL